MIVAALAAAGIVAGGVLLFGRTSGGGPEAAPPTTPTTPTTTAPDVITPSDASTPAPVSTSSVTDTTAPPSTGPLPAFVGPGEVPGEIFLEPVGSAGPDTYTGEIFVSPVDLSVAAGLAPTPSAAGDVDTSATEVQGRSAGTPGLYGGTRDNARCDADSILMFLQANPDKAAAWIAALNSDTTLHRLGSSQPLELEDLLAYFSELTPMVVTENTRVTNHGFRDGKPAARQSVLQAGSAVLVDLWGVPRVRCACGNPLIPPVASPTLPAYVGPSWAGVESESVVFVEPTPDPILTFVLTDVYSGETFSRPAGTRGAADEGTELVPPRDGVTVVAGPGAFPPTSGMEIDAPYDSASFTVYIDPAETDWIAFSGADHLVDQPAGGADAAPDGVLDILFPDVDDFLVIVATVNGVDSGPYVIHDRDAAGTPIGDQAVIYGYHPSVWSVSRIDWSTDPATSYTATGPEEGDMTSFIDAQGAGEYHFEVTFYNQWTSWVAHGPLFLLVGSATS